MTIKQAEEMMKAWDDSPFIKERKNIDSSLIDKMKPLQQAYNICMSKVKYYYSDGTVMLDRRLLLI